MTDNTATTTDLDERLATYTDAERQLVEFLSTYREVIQQWDALLSERDWAKRLLEQAVRSAGVGVSNELFAVTVSESRPSSGRVRINRQPGALFEVEKPVTGTDPRD